jgi:UDP-N-acetylglucosamine diphosphorylase / glucose-1-phosphate thymidylyltransferase / UDP-N-acetylgalactosamine diphosphorylase / glucosamine-1-phosphate N-acetyltransferase / galactosamine-1-phosphate N-acetyltransferase
VICIYEGDGLDRLSPLCDLRPAFDLRCGRFTLLEKFRRLYPDEPVFLWVRDEVAGIAAEAHPDCRVNVNPKQGRLFLCATAIFEEPVSAKGPESALLAGDEVVGFRVCAECVEDLASVRGLRADLAEEQVKARVVKWPWDLVEMNAAELLRETDVRCEMSDVRSKKSGNGKASGRIERGAVVVGDRKKLHLEPGSRVWPGTVISTETGPVFLDRDAVVRPGSFVEGPCFVGPGAVIDGAKVRPGCSFGPNCRIGGEVEASVFQGYANKHHEGFIGHAFVGEWVNLGALTTNSDLKNAYQPVQVTWQGKTIDTDLLKVGCFIGDHAKTAIGTLINTGVRIGTFSNWFEPGLSPKEIPAFAWGSKARWPLGHVLSSARKVMSRRGMTLSPAYEKALRTLYARCAGKTGTVPRSARTRGTVPVFRQPA